MGERYTEDNVPDLAGRTYFITGANTGIGFECARVLAARGAKALLGCRSESNAAEALERIRTRYPHALIDWVPLDLADLGSVAAAAQRVAAEPHLDGLINNAGVMMPPRTLTADGFEAQFGINHLGHFALTGRLLPSLRARAQARIVTVASNAHRFGVIDFDDVNAERGYRAGARYSMSKLANLLFTFELQRRLDAARSPVLAVACHPGGADTELARHFPRLLRAVIRPLARLVINTAAEGALPTLRAATAADVRGGDYYGPARFFETAGSAVRVQPGARATDVRVAGRLWELSVELTGVEPLQAPPPLPIGSALQ